MFMANFSCSPQCQDKVFHYIVPSVWKWCTLPSLDHLKHRLKGCIFFSEMVAIPESSFITGIQQPIAFVSRWFWEAPLTFLQRCLYDFFFFFCTGYCSYVFIRWVTDMLLKFSYYRFLLVCRRRGILKIVTGWMTSQFEQWLYISGLQYTVIQCKKKVQIQIIHTIYRI